MLYLPAKLHQRVQSLLEMEMADVPEQIAKPTSRASDVDNSEQVVVSLQASDVNNRDDVVVASDVEENLHDCRFPTG